jgi:acetamidase/formamidase
LLSKYIFCATSPFGFVAIAPNFTALPDDSPYEWSRAIRINTQEGAAEFRPGITLKLAPFFGSVGAAPPASMGRVSSNPTGLYGGNLDNRELTAGSTLYLPVHVAGGLLSVGDAHAVQGDGEVSCCAIETALIGTMQITVRKGRRLLWPRAETPTHYITMGLSPDLSQATQVATREMVNFLVTKKKLSREDAFTLCSVAMELRVTQVVDGTKGIHAMLQKSIFR